MACLTRWLQCITGATKTAWHKNNSISLTRSSSYFKRAWLESVSFLGYMIEEHMELDVESAKLLSR